MCDVFLASVDYVGHNFTVPFANADAMYTIDNY